MTFAIQSRPKLAALAAACLLTVALPAAPVMAKTKVKTPTEQTTPAETPAAAAKADFTVDIPTIDAVDSSLDETTLRAIFSGEIVDNAQALATLNATSITIPTIKVHLAAETDGEPGVADVTFQNVVLDNVVDGVAASIALGGIELSANKGDAKKGTATFGAIAAKNFSIGGVLGIYGLVDAGGQTELKTIYSDFSAAGGTITSDGVDCSIGTMNAAEFKGRPLKYSFVDFMALSSAMDTEGETPSPETIGKALRMYADIFTAFQSSPLTFGGFSCKGLDDDGKPLEFSIAGMNMGGMSPGTYPAISMQGLKVAVEGDGEVSVGNMEFKAMDLSGPLATVAAAPEAIDQAWLDANARGLVPAFAGFSLDSASMDIPDPDAAGQRITGKLGAFDLTLGEYRNGIPTDIDTSASNIVIDLPASSEDEQLQQLLDLGIKSVDFGFGLKAAWDEASDTIAIEDVSVNGVDLATIALAGTIGNATETLFDLDPDSALAAAMGVVIKNLKVNVVDAGLSDLILAQVSADQGSDAATMRPIFAGLAEGTILGMLAGATEGQKVGKAVSAFVRGEAKSLSIEMTAKDPAGLGMADFMAAEQDPTLLIGKTNITATAK